MTDALAALITSGAGLLPWVGWLLFLGLLAGLALRGRRSAHPDLDDGGEQDQDAEPPTQAPRRRVFRRHAPADGPAAEKQPVAAPELRVELPVGTPVAPAVQLRAELPVQPTVLPVQPTVLPVQPTVQPPEARRPPPPPPAPRLPRTAPACQEVLPGG